MATNKLPQKRTTEAERSSAYARAWQVVHVWLREHAPEEIRNAFHDLNMLSLDAAQAVRPEYEDVYREAQRESIERVERTDDDLVPGIVDAVFVERLARRCEAHLDKWLRANAPANVRELYSATIGLRHYATACEMHDSRVYPGDNRAAVDSIIAAVNACTVAGDEWDTL